MIQLIHHPEGEQRLGDFLAENLKKPSWKVFRAAVAFVKRSGVKHLAKPLGSFITHGTTKISVGIDHGVTSAEGLADLLVAVGSSGGVWVLHNETAQRPTFHPKIFLFSNENAAECFVGSGNLTEGGLFTNYEAFVHVQLDRKNPDDEKFFLALEALLDEWTNPKHETVKPLTTELIKELHENGYVPTEAEIQRTNEAVKVIQQTSAIKRGVKKLFGATRVKPAARAEPIEEKLALKILQPEGKGLCGFVMTLQQTDAGTGQVTLGASKRSPEIFIPLAARDANPAFWGWRKLFTQDPGKPGKWDRHAVQIRLGGQIAPVNMMTWPDKSDFRLRSAALRDAGAVGDILRIELADGKAGYDYYVEIVPAGSTDFARYQALCTNRVRNSKKQWGYY
ncbi:MAG TPA: phospholipase D family protein [Candidatus Sulfotelmatobacter sp.]|nr:phospholipase D family protein [Candidatus Sulfotelmatobacter sp.]